LAGVFGPVEPKGRREDESKAELKVLFFPAVGHQTPETTTYQYFLQNMFEDIILLSLHPKYVGFLVSIFIDLIHRSLIQIVVHVLSEDGSVRVVCSPLLSLIDRNSRRVAMQSQWR
jgi:hypothetical protein